MTDKNPRVAFFMSCYNHEKYVAEAMDSIVNQTYPYWELFVANDGSTDRTGEIISGYKDPRIHFYDLKENTKFAGAIDMLYDVIKPLDFDYVHSMASDDMIDVHKLEKQVIFMREHPQYAACFTWDKVIFSEGASDYPEDYSHVKNRSRYNWTRRFFEHGNCLNGNSVLIKKDVFYELDTMNEHYIALGDLRLWWMIASRYPIYLMQEELTYYRRHETNLSNWNLKKGMGLYQELFRMAYDIIRQTGIEDFRRSYYPLLTYKHCDTYEELLAEKLMVFLNAGHNHTEQGAIQFYYDHCSDRRFTSVLKENYGFDNEDFTFIKENGGLPYIINAFAVQDNKPVVIPYENAKPRLPGKILFEAVRNGGLTPETIGKFTWATLYSLQNMCATDDQTKALFSGVCTVIKKTRELWKRKQKEKKVIFIIAADSEWRLTADSSPVLWNDDTTLYVSYVNKEDVVEAIDCKQIVEEDKLLDSYTDTIHYIDLFDYNNQALYFADERIEELTDVYYVDCLNLDYECYDMVKGYSMQCCQYVIMDKKDYDLLDEDDKSLMRVMDGVFYYD